MNGVQKSIVLTGNILKLNNIISFSLIILISITFFDISVLAAKDDDDDDNDNNSDDDNDNVASYDESSNEGNWMGICNTVQSALYESCNQYVDDDGDLTTEGERAFGCIRNGALLGGGALTFGLPPGLITKGLEILSAPTGCDGIVNFQALNAIGNLDTILGFLN
jgi:hypothetical protein